MSALFYRELELDLNIDIAIACNDNNTIDNNTIDKSDDNNNIDNFNDMNLSDIPNYETEYEAILSIYDTKPLIQLKNDLELIIDKFVSKYENGLVQGSDEWIKQRYKTIGGSEAHVIALNEFFDLKSIFCRSEVKELILSKIGAKKFGGSVQTRWGNLFEPVIAEYFEKTYKCKIKGDEIFIKNIHKYQSYSPDGIAVVSIPKEFKFFRDMNLSDVNRNYVQTVTVYTPTCALIEFKSPWSRMPNGEIPEHYQCQVLSGLDTLKFCEIGLYCEGVFRSCSIHQWKDNSSYNLNIHTKDKEAFEGNYPIAAGFILFYSNVADVSLNNNKVAKTIFTKTIEKGQKIITTSDYICLDEITDFGCVNERDLGQVFACWHSDKKLQVHYSPVIINNNAHQSDDYEQIHTMNENRHLDNTMLERYMNEELYAIANKSMDGLKKKVIHVYGILPWKLMRADVISMMPQPGYIKSLQPKMKMVIDIIDQINTPMETFVKGEKVFIDPPISEKMSRYNQLFDLKKLMITTNKYGKPYQLCRALCDSSYNDGYDDN